jgi:hypothetical protein
MSVWLHFINVVVPISIIEDKLKVDFDEFYENYSEGIKFHDKYLFATGAMGSEHIEQIVKYFESKGLITIELIDSKEHFKDLCVVEVLFGGPTRPCNWLEFNSRESSAWLKGTEKGELIIPEVFKNQNEEK